MLTLANVSLLIEDAQAELHDWQKRFQSLEDLREFGCLPPALMSERKGTRNGQKSGVGLPVPNYTLGHGARLSTLYWPTGASRWGCGFFLADGLSKNTIVSAASEGSAGQAIRLKMGDESHSTLFVDMWLLPPHPVSAWDAGSPAERLWLLPVVDERYWWQFFDLGDYEVDGSTTWQDLVQQIGTQIGRSITVGTISGAYLNPDPVELTRKFDNCGLLLDAIAQSVGCRVVFRFENGSFELVLEDAATATTQHTANIASGAWQLLAGGKIPDTGHEPEDVVVTFPKWSWGVPWCDGDLFHHTIQGTAAGASPTGTFKIVHSSAYANMSAVPPGGVPLNSGTLQTLADQIRTDYYAWLVENYDYTYAGIKTWKVSGFDDWIEWSFGRQTYDKSRLAQTRVTSQPHNFGTEQQLSQHPNWMVLDHFQIGKLKEDLVPVADGGLGYAETEIWNTEAGNEAYINFDVRAYEWPNWMYQRADSMVWLHWHCDENAWYVFPEPLEIIRFELDEDKKLSQQYANAYKLDPDLAKIGDVIEVWDTVGKWHGRTGYQGWAVRMPDSAHYEILFLEGPARWIQFTLIGDLSSGEADATIKYYWGAAPNHRDPSDGSLLIKVYDRAKLFKRALINANGFAVYDETDNGGGVLGKYIVTQCNQMSPLLQAEVGPACAVDSSVPVGSWSAMVHAPFGQRPTTVASAQNVHSLAGPGGSRGTLAWNETTEQWELLQIQHRAKDILLTAGIRAVENCKLRIEGQTVNAALMWCGDEEDWYQDLAFIETEVIDGVSIYSVASSGSGDPGSCQLVIAKRTICHLPHTATVSQTTISLTASQVLTDVYLDGLCVYGTVAVVFGLCQGAEENVQLFCGTDCDSGSSGSG